MRRQPRNQTPAESLGRQGFKTVAAGYRDPVETAAIFPRVRAVGLNWTVDQPSSFIGGNHVIDAVAHRMETLSVPHDLERHFGYSPEPAK